MDALERLLRRCRGTIYQWALVQTGEAADAEDVAQEVLIKLHTSLGRYAGRSRFTTWLYQVTRNEALNLRRRLRSRLRLTEVITQEAVVDARTPSDPVARGRGHRHRGTGIPQPANAPGRRGAL